MLLGPALEPNIVPSSVQSSPSGPHPAVPAERRRRVVVAASIARASEVDPTT